MIFNIIWRVKLVESPSDANEFDLEWP